MRRKNNLPGFGLSLGYTIFYLSLLVLIPLAGLVFRAVSLPWDEIVKILSSPRVLAAYKLSFYTAAMAGTINVIFGFLVAWVLVRYPFPGSKWVDAFVDLPFALPTAVAGIALTAIYSKNGWVGHFFNSAGIKIAYTPIGIIIALTFIGLPFVVRTVQPVLQDLQAEMEEASASLGANRWQTFIRVIFPEIAPALVTGFTLAFARAIGEYGSVIFISGNMPMRTEIAPLLIMMKLEQFDYNGAIVIAAGMLVVSFILLFTINFLQGRLSRGCA